MCSLLYIQYVYTPLHSQPICIALDEEEKDIPQPFPLPKFPIDVAIALQQGKLLATTYQKFVSGVARAMLAFKRHPTPDERNRVASEIVGKYPFLKSPGNKAEVRSVVEMPRSMSGLFELTCICAIYV